MNVQCMNLCAYETNQLQIFMGKVFYRLNHKSTKCHQSRRYYWIRICDKATLTAFDMESDFVSESS